MAQLIIRDANHAAYIRNLLLSARLYHKSYVDDQRVLDCIDGLLARIANVGQEGLTLQIPNDVEGEMLSQICHGAQMAMEKLLIGCIR